MRTLFLFLFLSIATFSQSDKKKDAKVAPKSAVEVKKNIDANKKPDNSKDIIKKNDTKKEDVKPENPIKLNDTIVTVSKIAIDDAPAEEKELSYNVGFKLLNACNTSKIKKFTDTEVTKQLLKKISLSYISAICVNNNEEYGKFIGLELAEVLTNENIKTNIYRYKVEYERKLQKKEMRIYINKDGLISVIKTLKWKDKFELKKKPKPRPKKIAVDSLTIIDESFIIRN